MTGVVFLRLELTGGQKPRLMSELERGTYLMTVLCLHEHRGLLKIVSRYNHHKYI